MSTRTEHWPDLGYTCVAQHVAPSGGDPPLVVKWTIHPLPADPLAPNTVVASGRTKWDGCSDFTMSAEHAYHACSRDDMLTLGTLLARVHDLAGDMLPENRDFTPEPLL